MTNDYKDIRRALAEMVRILAPHSSADVKQAMAGILASAQNGKNLDNLALRYHHFGHLFFPGDDTAALELTQQIREAKNTGALASIIQHGEMLLPTDLLTWKNCPPVSPNNPLSYWLPVTEDLTACAQTKSNTSACTAPPTNSVTKRELVNGLDLVGTTWKTRLSHPDREGSAYLLALVQKARRGDRRGSLWNPITFAKIAVEKGHLNKGRALALFKKAWPHWQDEFEAEIGEI